MAELRAAVIVAEKECCFILRECQEPPDADPHVRWWGGRGGDPPGYPIGPLPEDFRPPACAIEDSPFCITEMTMNPATQEHTIRVANTKSSRHDLVAAVVRRKCGPARRWLSGMVSGTDQNLRYNDLIRNR